MELGQAGLLIGADQILKPQILGSERPIMTQVKMSQPLHIVFLIVTRTVGTFLSLLCVTQGHNPWVGNFSGGNALTLRKSTFNAQGIFFRQENLFHTILFCTSHRSDFSDNGNVLFRRD